MFRIAFLICFPPPSVTHRQKVKKKMQMFAFTQCSQFNTLKNKNKTKIVVQFLQLIFFIWTHFQISSNQKKEDLQQEADQRATYGAEHFKTLAHLYCPAQSLPCRTSQLSLYVIAFLCQILFYYAENYEVNVFTGIFL